MLANWQRFVHDPVLELDPLVKLAVSHYQFEAIHPFTDGNGRTGRIINLALIRLLTSDDAEADQTRIGIST